MWQSLWLEHFPWHHRIHRACCEKKRALRDYFILLKVFAFMALAMAFCHGFAIP